MSGTQGRREVRGQRGTDDDVIRLEYDLFNLPTTQHRAGLAGLVLQVRAMEPNVAPVIEHIGPHSLTVVFSRKSMIDLFDVLYDTTTVRFKSDKILKSPDGKPFPYLRESVETIKDKKTGKVKEVPKYEYERSDEPRCGLLAHRVHNDHPLLKLVRDQVKQVIRTSDKSREIYKVHAKMGTSGVGEKLWSLIAKGKTEKISGSSRLGVEGTTAEGSLFKEDARLLLLLHFWPVVSLPYVPNSIRIDHKRLDFKITGIATAVPEVAELDTFCDIFPRLLDDLASDETLAGYRPRSMIIDCPEQAGLDMSSRVCALVAGGVSSSEIGNCLSAVEVWWTEKGKRSVRTHMIRRIDGRPELARQYALIKPMYRDRLFRTIATTALVKGTTIPVEAGRYYRLLPYEVMTGRRFGADVGRYFQGIKRQVKELNRVNLTVDEADLLSGIVHRMVTQSLRQKVKGKTGHDPFDKKFKKLP